MSARSTLVSTRSAPVSGGEGNAPSPRTRGDDVLERDGDARDVDRGDRHLAAHGRSARNRGQHVRAQRDDQRAERHQSKASPSSASASCSGATAAPTPSSAAFNGGVGSPIAGMSPSRFGSSSPSRPEVGERVEVRPELGAEVVDRRRRLGRLDVLPQPHRVAERVGAVVRLLELEPLDQHLLELGRGDDVGDERDRLAALNGSRTAQEVVALGVAVQRPDDLDREAVPPEVVVQVADEPGDGEARETTALHGPDPLDARHLPLADHRPDDHGLESAPAPSIDRHAAVTAALRRVVRERVT